MIADAYHNPVNAREPLSAAAAAAAAVPGDFAPVSQRLHSWIDRKLGYFGADHFVLFYYDPRGGEVVWRDCRSYGFGSGGWMIFLDQVVPIANEYGVSVGSEDHSATHVLLIDRVLRQAYFAERRAAEQFIKHQHEADVAAVLPAARAS